MIYVIVGKCCSGKTEAMRYFQKRGLGGVEASRYAAELKRESEVKTMDEVFAKYPMDTIARRICADLPNDSLVISGFRTVAELEYVRGMADSMTIAMKSSDHKRLERWMNREGHGKTDEDFWTKTRSDDELGLSRLMCMADIPIENEGDLEELHRQIDSILESSD